MTINFAGRAQWGEYSPNNLGWGGRWDPLAHPDLLVRFTFTTSRGETLRFGSMHRLVVPIFREFYTRLDAKHPGVLHADPDEGCYNPNSVTENGSRSFHTYGIATDTEWNNNPMGVGVRRSGDGVLPDDTGAIGEPLMIQWGGKWTSFKDYMHNEFHGTPQDAIDLAAALATQQTDWTDDIMSMTPAERDKLIDDIATAAAAKVWDERLHYDTADEKKTMQAGTLLASVRAQAMKATGNEAAKA